MAGGFAGQGEAQAPYAGYQGWHPHGAPGGYPGPDGYGEMVNGGDYAYVIREDDPRRAAAVPAAREGPKRVARAARRTARRSGPACRRGSPRPRDHRGGSARRVAGERGRTRENREPGGRLPSARARGPGGEGDRPSRRGDPGGPRYPGGRQAQAGGRARRGPRSRLRTR